jgi:hypothetical protein
MKRVAVIAILAAFMVSVLWIGTTHRDRCMKAGNVACSIVPWSGHPAPAKKATKPPISSFWGDSQ